jgi:4-carboxymuconolactone decarboxylase
MSQPDERSPNDQSRYERGVARLTELAGPGAAAGMAELGELGRYIIEFAYGDIYSRPGLSLRDRELVAIAVLAAQGARDRQLVGHFGAALHHGITPDEIEEVILQTVLYAGLPTAINALNLWRDWCRERGR